MGYEGFSAKNFSGPLPRVERGGNGKPDRQGHTEAQKSPCGQFMLIYDFQQPFVVRTILVCVHPKRQAFGRCLPSPPPSLAALSFCGLNLFARASQLTGRNWDDEFRTP
jgi:hypothetical protein